MPSKIIFSIVLYLISQFAFSQKLIHGKIMVKDATPKGVLIINLANEKETVSDIKGEFDIEAKIDDLLIFPSSHLDYQHKIIEPEDYKNASITVEMTSKTIQLEQVTIIKPLQFDAVKLGILTKPAKKYTVAERRFFYDRNRRTFKNLGIERKNWTINYLSELFPNDYYTEELKIEPDHVRGFLYYAVEDWKLTSAVQSKNKALISFILLQLSMDYNFLQGYNKPKKQPTKIKQ